MTAPAPSAAPAHRFNLASQAGRDWHDRADVVAALLAGEPAAARRPSPLRVADIGCGDAKLRDALVAHGVDVDYVGFDLLPQSSAVAVFDVERDRLPAGLALDAIALVGVGEYLADLAGAYARLRPHADWIVTSHVLAGSPPVSPARLAELGWRQHLTAPQFIDCLGRAGLRPLHRRRTADARTLVVLCATDRPASGR